MVPLAPFWFRKLMTVAPKEDVYKRQVDKPTANPDKIKEELAAMNYLVEEWGGKYQSQDISAKKGMGV